MGPAVSLSERRASLAQPDFAEKARLMAAMASESEVSGAARSVGVVLLHHWNMVSGQCNPSVAVLATETRLDRSTVRRALRELIEAGLFGELETSASDRARGLRQYRPQLDRLQAAAADRFGDETGRYRPTAWPNDPSAGRYRPAHIEPKKEPEKEHNQDQLSQDFQRLVTAYQPVPGDPIYKALPEYQRAVQAGAKPDAIQTAAACYRDHLRQPAQSWQAKCHLVRWLREKRWRDHAPYANGGNDSTIVLPINITDDCPAEAAARWRSIVEAAAQRHGHEAVASWFAELHFDGETVWSTGRFVRDQVVNRFGAELEGLSVQLRPSDAPRAPPS